MPSRSARKRREGWSPSRESKPALPLTGRLHRLNASGRSAVANFVVAGSATNERSEPSGGKLTNGRRSRCASRKTGAVARSVVLFWTFTMSNSKGRTSPFTRAGLRRAHARKFGSSRRAQPQIRTRERTLRSVGQLGISVTGPSGPSCLFGGGFLARRRLVCRYRPLSGQTGHRK